MSFNTEDYELVPRELIQGLRDALKVWGTDFISGSRGLVLTAARAVIDSVDQTKPTALEHDHEMVCIPEQPLICGQCGQTYIICKVCHKDLFRHHATCH